MLRFLPSSALQLKAVAAYGEQKLQLGGVFYKLMCCLLKARIAHAVGRMADIVYDGVGVDVEVIARV